jgi:hypothetical protein
MSRFRLVLVACASVVAIAPAALALAGPAAIPSPPALRSPAASNPTPSTTSGSRTTHSSSTHTYRLPKGATKFTWAQYRPAAGSGLPMLSGTVEMAFDQGDGEMADAVPAGIVPALPAKFAPDILVNQDLSATPHNETAVAVDPNNPRRIVVGANDYRMGFGSSGFYTTSDGGATWRDGILPFPTVNFEPLAAVPGQETNHRTLLALDGGGDPALAFDHAGTVYYADIQFHRVGCASGVLVYRSINGGLTWNRPLFGAPSSGDPRNNGDGVVVMNANDNNCNDFYDKEFLTTGPRPKGAALVPGTDTTHLSPDRIYVTYTDFKYTLPPVAAQPYVAPVYIIESVIDASYSDDQGRHWSTPAQISGSSSTLCPGSPVPPTCADDQASSPVVDPRTGKIYVMYFNQDTDSNPVTEQVDFLNGAAIHGQMLIVSSSDGGATWTPPALVGTLKDDNLPVASSTHCPDNAGRQLLGDTCFRWAAFGTNVTLDPNTGRLYAVLDDNRNGTVDRTDVDVFAVTSTDGQKWSAPVRVNKDPLKDGKDQFFPWGSVGADGTFYVSFLDRAADPHNHDIGTTVCSSRDAATTFTCSAASTGLWNPDLAFRGGLFIGDYTGNAPVGNTVFAAWPDARRAEAALPGDNPPPLLSDTVGAFWGSGRTISVLAKKVTAPAAMHQTPAAALPATGVGLGVRGMLPIAVAIALTGWIRRRPREL